jgi:hypothetical protein
VVSALVAVTLGVAGCAGAPGEPGPEVLSADRLAPLVAALPDRPSEASTIPRPANVAAPTNRWYSGMVFGDGKKPVFPMPMSFQLLPGGFAFGVPDVAAGGAGVVAPAVSDLTITTGTDAVQLVRSDEVSVTVAPLADGVPQGELTIARGSPIVSYRVLEDSTATLSAPMSTTERHRCRRHPGSAVRDGRARRALSPPTAPRSPSRPAPTSGGSDPRRRRRRGNRGRGDPVTGVTTGYDVGGDVTVTRLRYETEGDAPTLIAVTAQQKAALDESDGMRCGLGEFTTLLGVPRALFRLDAFLVDAAHRPLRPNSTSTALPTPSGVSCSPP